MDKGKPIHYTFELLATNVTHVKHKHLSHVPHTLSSVLTLVHKWGTTENVEFSADLGFSCATETGPHRGQLIGRGPGLPRSCGG